MKDWHEFYSLSKTMPRTAYTRGFLSRLPANARVLDFGSGNGIWAAAFHRDRPDLTIDLIDKNPPDRSLIPKGWRGIIYRSDFQSFNPTQTYDGIWANNSLFFLSPDEIAPVFHKLAEKLAPDGIIDFSMLQSGPTAPSARTSISRQAIGNLLKAEHLRALTIKLDEDAEFIVAAGRRKFPTFFIQAQKHVVG